VTWQRDTPVDHVDEDDARERALDREQIDLDRVERDRRAMSYVPAPELRCARTCPEGHVMTLTRVCRRGWCDGCRRVRLAVGYA
jgi:hypothetical protein